MNAESHSIHRSSADAKLVSGLALVVGILFFITEHDWQASLRETFAVTASEMELSVSSGSLARRLAFPILALCGLVWFMRGRHDVSWRGLLPWAMAAYVCFCMASLLWSDDPSLTARRLITLGCFALGAVGLGTRLDLPGISQLALLVSVAYVSLGLATEVLLGSFRPWLPDYRFAGTVHPNAQALYCGVACLASIAVRNQSPVCRFLWLAPFPLAVLLIMTGSRTGCAAWLAGLAAYGLARCSWRVTAAASCSVVAITPLVLLVTLLADVDLARSAEQLVLMGRDDHAETLTGRLPLWDELSVYVQTRPLLGYGYNSFWDADHIYAISSTLKWGIGEAHNAYLESILSVGLIGTLMLLVALMLAAGRAASQHRETKLAGYDFLLAMLVLGFANALLESGMLLLRFVPFMIAVGVSHLALRAPQEGQA